MFSGHYTGLHSFLLSGQYDISFSNVRLWICMKKKIISKQTPPKLQNMKTGAYRFSNTK